MSERARRYRPDGPVVRRKFRQGLLSLGRDRNPAAPGWGMVEEDAEMRSTSPAS